jgi:hypothetical protein
MKENEKSILPSFILVGGEGDSFDPFHDFFPENLKRLPQYWNFGELLKFVFYGLEDRHNKTILDKLMEQRNIWNTIIVGNQEIEDFVNLFSQKEPIYGSRYLTRDEEGEVRLRTGPLSESERVDLFLESLDTDKISGFLRIILGRELTSYEDLQLVLALQRLKGMSVVGEILATISGYKFNAFYRRYPTGRKTKVKRFLYRLPNDGNHYPYGGMWVYDYYGYFEEVEVDEYYLGEGWEKYSGYLGNPVRYDGREQYAGSGELIYGEIRFIPEPCEVWLTADVSHLEVDQELAVFENIVEGFRNLTSSCAKILFFPFMNFEEKDFSLDNEVVLEEVSYLVEVAGEGGSVIKTPEELTDRDTIINPKFQEYRRTVETYH